MYRPLFFRFLALVMAMLILASGCSGDPSRNRAQGKAAVRLEPIRVPHDFDSQRVEENAPGREPLTNSEQTTPVAGQFGNSNSAPVAGQSENSNSATAPAAFVVEIEDAEPNGGVVRIAIFDNANNFESRQDPVRSSQQVAAGGRCTWEITDLAPGQYAVAAFQDNNGNGELDKGSFGIPKEPYGFSRQATKKLLPPSYEQARVNHQHETTSVKVILR
jgi:uncharacterized protein (DUF2141 family)